MAGEQGAFEGKSEIGCKILRSDSSSVSLKQVADFARFLGKLAAESGLRGELREEHFIEGVSGSPVQWRRLSRVDYPAFFERITVLDPAQFGETTWPVPARTGAAGELIISADCFADNEQNFGSHREEWSQLFQPDFAIGNKIEGGLSYNLLKAPAAALADGQIDVRPLVLHALAPDGRACDRGNLASQKAIANSFWQTFWATGALRAERGAVFPVAFLPIDRTNPMELEPPFAIRQIAPNRSLIGRTAILAFITETLTQAGALYFDRANCLFCVADHFDRTLLSTDDIRLGILELVRTGFIDAYTGDNKDYFSSWPNNEASYAPNPWDTSEFEELSESVLFCSPDENPDRYIRIRRVVPFAGCAFLREIMTDLDSLKKCGKVQDFEDEILASTNSTFFLNFPEEYANLHSAMNEPVALLIENGRPLQAPTLNRATFSLNQDGSAVITTDSSRTFHTAQLTAHLAATAYSVAKQSFRHGSIEPDKIGNVWVGSTWVESVIDLPLQVPSNGSVWSLKPEFIPPNLKSQPVLMGQNQGFEKITGGVSEDEIKSKMKLEGYNLENVLDSKHAFTVGPMLAQDGQPVPFGTNDEQFQPIVLRESPSFEASRNLSRTQLPDALLDCDCRGVPPTRFPHDWDKTRAPRTAIGVTKTGDVLLVVVDGRADLAHSTGMTLAELADLMIELGCKDAMNLDGGGSSIMYVADPGVIKLKLRPEFTDGLVSFPSDLGGTERMLPVPLVICRKKSK